MSRSAMSLLSRIVTVPATSGVRRGGALLRSPLSRRLTRMAVPVGLATAAFTVSLLTDARLLVYGTAAVALVAMLLLWRSHRQVAGPVPVTARLVLGATVVTEHAAGAPTPGWPLALAGAVLVGALTVEPVVHRAARPLYFTAHLDPPTPMLARVFNRSAVVLANTGLLGWFILAGLLGLPGWLWLAVAAAAVVVTAGTVLAAARRRVTGRSEALARLRLRVAAHQPRFMLYFTAPPGSDYQILMWLPQLQRLGERFVVLLREPDAYDTVVAATDAPVLYCPEMTTFDACVVPSLTTVFYVNNGARNAHCVRYEQLTHIFLNHGDSDKASSFNPVTAMYDRVFVAGEAGIERYRAHGVDIARERFRIVGRPQVAGVAPAQRPVSDKEQPVVLYAPTWTGYYADANYSSLPIARAIVRGLLDRGATVILRHHPYTNRNRAAAQQLAHAQQLLAADAAATGRAHVWGADATTGMTLIDCFNRSDALVSDVSSVASEHLYSEKPFAITDMGDEGKAFLDSFPLARVAYVIDRHADNLPEALGHLLVTDPDRSARAAARVHYLGDFPRESYADAFVAEARRHL